MANLRFFYSLIKRIAQICSLTFLNVFSSLLYILEEGFDVLNDFRLRHNGTRRVRWDRRLAKIAESIVNGVVPIFAGSWNRYQLRLVGGGNLTKRSW